MADQKRLSAYFISKRSAAKSPYKKGTVVKKVQPVSSKKGMIRNLFAPPSLATPVNEVSQFLSACDVNTRNVDVDFPGLGLGSGSLNADDLSLAVIKPSSEPVCSDKKDQRDEEFVGVVVADEAVPLLSNGGDFATPSLSSCIHTSPPGTPKKPVTCRNLGALSLGKRVVTFGDEGRRVEKSKVKNPAYRRFERLLVSGDKQAGLQKSADCIKSSVSLYLPRKYQRIYEMFSSAETALCVLSKRGEACRFGMLKVSVERMCNMVFERRHLQMIVHVWPEAYRLHSSPPNCGGGRLLDEASSDDHLVIEPNYPTEMGTPEGDTVVKVVTDRRGRFYSLLMDRTHQHHRDFLLSIGVADVPPASQIQRWHPRFRVEELPDLELACLPVQGKTSVYSAKDMLDMVMYKDDDRVRLALEAVSSALSPAKVRCDPPCHSLEEKEGRTQIQPKPGLLSLVPDGVLERVRSKELDRNRREMLRDQKQEAFIAKLERLPDVIRHLNSLFISERRPYLSIRSCGEKLRYSCLPSMDVGEVEEHIKLVASELPNWLLVVNLHGESYISNSKSSVDVSTAIDLVNKAIVARRRQAGRHFVE